jgi:hypothetical protein
MPAVVAAGIAFAPLAQAESGDQSAADQAVTATYNQVQARCTPSTPPHLQSITWHTFHQGSWGKGRIHDANPRLGGPFKAYWTNPRVGPARNDPAGRTPGQWNVDLGFC